MTVLSCLYNDRGLPFKVVERFPFCDVVDEKRTDGASVVSGCYGAVSLLPGRVPYLRLERFPFHADTPVDVDTLQYFPDTAFDKKCHKIVFY